MSKVLESKDVCMYFGGLKAVEKVSMSIDAGDIYGIIGPNGAGKTTFFNVCSGIYRPTHGTVELLGEDITNLNSADIARRGMARTFQNIKLFNYMTVLDNVKAGFHNRTKTNVIDAILRNKTYKRDEEMATEKSLAILKMVDLLEEQDTMAGNLAYGVQRKVEIARALALDPQILLLDEPAAGMNPNETQSLIELVKKLNQLGYTIAVIEHDMKFVMNSCNQILVLNFGQELCKGTPEEIQGSKCVQEAYFGKGTVTRGAVKFRA